MTTFQHNFDIACPKLMKKAPQKREILVKSDEMQHDMLSSLLGLRCECDITIYRRKGGSFVREKVRAARRETTRFRLASLQQTGKRSKNIVTACSRLSDRDVN